MQIHGLNKTTLLDYPEHVAATVFTGNCNFRCPFCHNGELVVCPETQPVIEEEEVLSFLKKRKGILQGVCITGGEPTIQKDLEEFIRKVRDLGYKIKLDTNGYRPAVLASLIHEKLLDYVAMDIKSSKTGYSRAAGVKIDIHYIEESVDCIRDSGLPYEFRTTVVRQLHEMSDFVEIGDWLEGSRAYYLQKFQDSGTLLQPGMTGYSKEEMEQFAEVLKKKIKIVGIRGAD